MKKAPQKLLGIGAAPWRLCREDVSELTVGEYGVGVLGFGRGVTAKRVGESAAALRFVWAIGWSGQTDGSYDDRLIEGAAQYWNNKLSKKHSPFLYISIIVPHVRLTAPPCSPNEAARRR